VIRVEDATVAERGDVDEVLVAGEPVADRGESVGLGHAVIGEVGQTDQRDRDQVLGARLLRGRHARYATQVDRLVRVVFLRRHHRVGVRRAT